MNVCNFHITTNARVTVITMALNILTRSPDVSCSIKINDAKLREQLSKIPLSTLAKNTLQSSPTNTENY